MSTTNIHLLHFKYWLENNGQIKNEHEKTKQKKKKQKQNMYLESVYPPALGVFLKSFYEDHGYPPKKQSPPLHTYV